MKINFNSMKNLSNKEILIGVRYGLNNFLDLYNSAFILKENKKFGIANSLLILSIEELIKAITLFAMLIAKPEDRKWFKDFFEYNNNSDEDNRSLHKKRHEIAKYLKLILSQNNLKKLEGLNTNPTTSEIYKIMDKEIDTDQIEKITSMNFFSKWFDKANDTKNAGIYVGYNKKWYFPQYIEEKDFIKSIAETKDLIFVLSNSLNNILSIPYSDLIKFINYLKKRFYK
ncbi:MAG: AbiV family abortive infection protein [Bacteroidetes bacterium]|nr:MAG: AbiV family abortive infection protein [Bacteroidota bacterium]